jgi:hypothetical protein
MSSARDKKQKVSEKAQPLSLIDHYENVLVIKDEELGKTIDVVIRGGVLYCDLHSDSDTYGERQPDCLHIEYAQTLPQLAKFKKNGRLQ